MKVVPYTAFLYYEKNNPTVTRALLKSEMNGIRRKQIQIQLVDCFNCLLNLSKPP